MEIPCNSPFHHGFVWVVFHVRISTSFGHIFRLFRCWIVGFIRDSPCLDRWWLIIKGTIRSRFFIKCIQCLEEWLVIWSPQYYTPPKPIGSMVLLYMVTWIPSIYPLYVSIYTSTMDPSWEIGILNIVHTNDLPDIVNTNDYVEY